jgi:hypothetical protein
MNCEFETINAVGLADTKVEIPQANHDGHALYGKDSSRMQI